MISPTMSAFLVLQVMGSLNVYSKILLRWQHSPLLIFNRARAITNAHSVA